jgi:hypothetical protein
VQFDLTTRLTGLRSTAPNGRPSRSPSAGRSADFRPSPTSQLVIVCAALATILLAACGGSRWGAQHPSSSASSPANEAFKFAQCTREHGAHVEASTPGGPVAVKLRIVGNVTAQKLGAAQNACRKYAPYAAAKRSLRPAEKVAREEALLNFAKCIREHGVQNFPNPSTGGQLTHEMLANAGISPHQPAVLQAADARTAVTHGVITKTTVPCFAAGH